MTVTTTKLTRAAGLCAAAAGLLYIGVQVNHPHLDATFATTTEYAVRQSMKVVMAALSLVGITAMYLRQVSRIGLLGLLGYVVFGAGYLVIMSVEVVGAFVLPAIAGTAPGYVNDVLAVATGGHALGDIGGIGTAIAAMGILYLVGGLIFGIALVRAHVLARWAAVLLAFGSLSTAAISVLPQVNERLFAVPTGVALVGLGYSLWRDQRTAAALPTTIPVTSGLDAVGAK